MYCLATDIESYPHHAWNFGFKTPDEQSKLVILPMAWTVRSKKLPLSGSPDMEVLKHWLDRIEPVLRSPTQEIICIFANRFGQEGPNLDAGTSAVLGIKLEVVTMHGILGFNAEELLVANTELGNTTGVQTIQDGAFALAMSTFWDGKTKVKRVRKRPKETAGNAKVSRVPFGNSATKEL
ncbi:hypothetical protein IFR05_014488 [Cadophora sp. M221]|nr:hypothetical protein IFR05_014488 [Cadophora sp. M221]